MPTEYVRWNGEWREVISTPSTIDSFEDGDISEYTGDTGSYTVDGTSPVFDGSNSLKNLDSAGGTAIIISTSGLDAYPSRGDTFRANIQPEGTGGASPGLVFGAVDTSNHYFARLNGQSAIELYKRSGGTASLINDDPFALTTGTEYIFEVVWGDDDTITFRLLDSGGSELASASGSDAEFSSATGFGWYNSAASGHVYDNARII